jgi:hypothetical protein
MPVRELLHRVEIGELLIRYTRAIDSGDWDALDTIFTPDAELDLTAPGGPKGGLKEVKTWLAEALAHWPGRQHLLGAPLIEFPIDPGDTAIASVSFTDTLSPSRDMIKASTSGRTSGGGIYHHRLVLLPEGWRSRAMTIEQQWRVIA